MRIPNSNPITQSEYEDGRIAGVEMCLPALYDDPRGWLIELYRANELPVVPVMGYLSSTQPNIQRGPHEHMTQTDVFVFLDDFLVVLWDNRPGSPTYGKRTVISARRGTRIVVPPGVVHAYKRLSVHEGPGLVYNAPDIPYGGWGRDEGVDEIRHEQDPFSPFNINIEFI